MNTQQTMAKQLGESVFCVYLTRDQLILAQDALAEIMNSEHRNRGQVRGLLSGTMSALDKGWMNEVEVPE